MNRITWRGALIVVIATAGMIFLLAPQCARADGESVYKAKCAMCHAADGSGSTAIGKAMKLRDLRSEDVQKQTDEQLIDITANGKAKMPAYKGKLTDEEIKQVVAFIRELAKKK